MWDWMQDKYQLTPKVYIFGAQSRAKTIRGYLQYLYPETEIVSFLVDDMEGNQTVVDKIPVQMLSAVDEMDSSCDVFIATKGIYHAEIRERLERKGIWRIIPVTVEIDNYFRNAYVKKYYGQQHIEFIKITDLSVRQPDIVIYMVKSIYDNTLQTGYVCPDYEKIIQAGAALTEQRLFPNVLTDCTGENISSRNRQYCELTALYWIWKNTKEEIIGLSHYRRHFIFPEQWRDIMIWNSIDVILPVPTFVYPSIEENYRERHDPSDWEYLMEYLRECSPDDYTDAVKVFSGSMYLPCNMFVMRREILDDLCGWMFPILHAVTEHGGTKEDVYLNRYPGFISERLMTLYFYKNRCKYKMVYADKNFIN